MSEELIDPQSIRAGTPDWQEGYEQGVIKGEYDLNRIVALKEDLAYEKGYEAGKQYAQNKVDELLKEVIGAYEEVLLNSPESKSIKAQINAVKFALHWVRSGGDYDFDGNRICLPW